MGARSLWLRMSIALADDSSPRGWRSSSGPIHVHMHQMCPLRCQYPKQSQPCLQLNASHFTQERMGTEGPQDSEQMLWRCECAVSREEQTASTVAPVPSPAREMQVHSLPRKTEREHYLACSQYCFGHQPHLSVKTNRVLLSAPRTHSWENCNCAKCVGHFQAKWRRFITDQEPTLSPPSLKRIISIKSLTLEKK